MTIAFMLQVMPCSWIKQHALLPLLWRSKDCLKRSVCSGGRHCFGPEYLWKSEQELDVQEHLSDYEAAAARDDVSSQMALAQYLNLTPEDEQEAIKWYQSAAKQGNIKAQILLGRLYERKGDRIEAVKWMKQAAEGGNRESIRSLGRLQPTEGEEVYFWKYIAACIDDSQLPTNIAAPAEDIIKSCPQTFWGQQGDKARLLSIKQREAVEKKAEDWIRAHKIEPHPPNSAIIY